MRDHGGRISRAAAEFGGAPGDWIDLSTGINPIAYPLPDLPLSLWKTLPDQTAEDRLIRAARGFWNVPDGAALLAASGASALIAALPGLRPKGRVQIATKTYNEHEAAFRAAGWEITREAAPVRVLVRPNNPDGALEAAPDEGHDLLVIDESFCDVTPDQSRIGRTGQNRTIILKSFGKFWGLAGLRLGFAIGDPGDIAALTARIGPWAVSGPALEIAANALADVNWADETRRRLARDRARLDRLLLPLSQGAIAGTDLFRLANVEDAQALHDHLARRHILTRIFPYEKRWIRFGLPGPERDWQILQTALEEFR